MGFLFGDKKADPKKREPGYGVIGVKPYLFHKPEAMFKELRDKVLPYLSEEEEETILGFFADEPRREFRALVPKDVYEAAKEKTIDAESFEIRAHSSWRGATVDRHCCSDWSRDGCCGGIIMNAALQEMDRRHQLHEQTELLKDYCIISNIHGMEALEERNRIERDDHDAFLERIHEDD